MILYFYYKLYIFAKMNKFSVRKLKKIQKTDSTQASKVLNFNLSTNNNSCKNNSYRNIYSIKNTNLSNCSTSIYDLNKMRSRNNCKLSVLNSLKDNYKCADKSTSAILDKNYFSQEHNLQSNCTTNTNNINVCNLSDIFSYKNDCNNNCTNINNHKKPAANVGTAVLSNKYNLKKKSFLPFGREKNKDNFKLPSEDYIESFFKGKYYKNQLPVSESFLMRQFLIGNYKDKDLSKRKISKSLFLNNLEKYNKIKKTIRFWGRLCDFVYPIYQLDKLNFHKLSLKSSTQKPEIKLPKLYTNGSYKQLIKSKSCSSIKD